MAILSYSTFAPKMKLSGRDPNAKKDGRVIVGPNEELEIWKSTVSDEVHLGILDSSGTTSAVITWPHGLASGATFTQLRRAVELLNIAAANRVDFTTVPQQYVAGINESEQDLQVNVPNAIRISLSSNNEILLQTKQPAVDTEVGILLRVLDGVAEDLRQVSMGADDSGGAGFRVLRVPN